MSARKCRLQYSKFVSCLFIALSLVIVLGAHAQTLTVLHNFTDGADGASPWVGVTMDQAGNLYGTTAYGGDPNACSGYGCGVVFKMARRNSRWTFAPIYTFTGGQDGAVPLARVVFGPNGSLYGSTFVGGNGYYAEGTGVIFNLQPPAHASGRVFDPWVETVLYRFGGVSDGNWPSGDLIFGAGGSIFGTTQSGGYECEDTVYCGTVFELSPNGSGWTENVLYEFNQGSVAVPMAGLVFDQVGRLYGTTSNSSGAVFQLAQSGSFWTETTVYRFLGGSDGYMPVGGLVYEPPSHFFGTTEFGGVNGLGTVYQLDEMFNGWTHTVLYSLTNGHSPQSTLFRDSAGNLYGTTCNGGANNSGTVFKLENVGGTWTEQDLYQFTGGNDGYCPLGQVIVDSGGNVYGTTIYGGTSQHGVVFEISPS